MGGRIKSDRETRLSEALEGSADAEEALLKRCARAPSMTGAIGSAANAVDVAAAACSAVETKGTAELEDCGAQIVREVAGAYRVEEELRRWAKISMSQSLTGDRGCDNVFKKHGNSMWQVDGESNARGKTKKTDKPGKPFDARTGHQHMREWWNELNQGVGDKEASVQLLALAAEARAIAESTLTNKGSGGPLSKKPIKTKAKNEERSRPEIIKATPCVSLVFPEPIIECESTSARKQRDETLKELFWALRNQVYELRALNKEYVGRTRSLRFFRAIEEAQEEFSAVNSSNRSGGAAPDSSRTPLSKRAIFSCCGHVGEVSKMRAAAIREECPVDGCHANVRAHSIVECSSLGSNANTSDALVSAKHGAKLGKIVSLIRRIPKHERILIFIQFEDLL